MSVTRIHVDASALAAMSATLQRAQRQVEQVAQPLRGLAGQLALYADTQARARRLTARAGARNGHVVRSVLRLPLPDVVAIVDAVEHDATIEPRLQPFVDVVRAALTGRTITRRQVVRARRAARRPLRAALRRRPDRRVDQRTRIEAGCTSRPRAPGDRSARSHRPSAPARPVTNTRGSPV